MDRGRLVGQVVLNPDPEGLALGEAQLGAGQPVVQENGRHGLLAVRIDFGALDLEHVIGRIRRRHETGPGGSGGPHGFGQGQAGQAEARALEQPAA